MAAQISRPSWRIRRTIIVSTLIFCAVEILYLTIWGQSTDLAETIANGLILLAGSVIAAYVFGATWDDKNVMALSRRGSRPRDLDAGPEGDVE